MSVTTLAVFLCILPASSLRIADPEQSKDIYSFFDSSCKLHVDTKQKKLFLKSDTGNFVVNGGQVEDENGKVIGKTTPKPMICESDTGPTEKSHAFINVASDAPYLNKYLDPFFNKHCWAKTNGVKYYLMFGQADAEMKQVYKQKSPGAAHCSEGSGDISHYFYPIAMKIILEEKQVSWLVSMDISDAYFNGHHWNEGAHLMQKLLKDDMSDVAFAAQFDKSGAWINGALWGIKNTEYSKQWLKDVYKNRCGFMNQQAYWNTFLEHFHQEKPELMKEQSISSYLSAKSKMPHLVVPMLSPEQQPVYRKYRSDATLREPLYFGKHMMILPNAPPEGAEPGSFVGFRGDKSGAEPFMCHWSPHNWLGDSSSVKKAEFKEVETTELEASKGCRFAPCAGGAVCQCEA